MSIIDVEQLLQPVSEESPCGEDLEYDGVFAEMTRAAEGKPEQQMGEQVIEAQPPDWGEVRAKALELLSRTKDLRVGLHLTQAVSVTEGMVGLGDSLALIKGLIERYWDGVHPRLDPDDDNDPTMRMNILASLCDEGSVLRSIREAPLVDSRALGRFGLRDIEIALGQAQAPEGSEPANMAMIEGAFLDCDLESLQGTADAVNRSLEHLQSIDALLLEKVGSHQVPDLAALPAVLKAAKQVLSEQLTRRGVGEAAPAAAEGGAEAVAAAPQPIAGEVNSREDVIRVLDKACDYFARNEPSSPVPLLLRRAKRLVSKDFMDIIRDIAPEGVSQVETVTGAKADTTDEWS
jgi:type VI secretion system protein ImpA